MGQLSTSRGRKKPFTEPGTRVAFLFLFSLYTLMANREVFPPLEEDEAKVGWRKPLQEKKIEAPAGNEKKKL